MMSVDGDQSKRNLHLFVTDWLVLMLLVPAVELGIVHNQETGEKSRIINTG